MTKLLDKINYPSDLRIRDKKKLKKISEELRTELIDVVSETGGHLGAGVGVVEFYILRMLQVRFSIFSVNDIYFIWVTI